jgi:hypothetical protein
MNQSLSLRDGRVDAIAAGRLVPGSGCEVEATSFRDRSRAGNRLGYARRGGLSIERPGLWNHVDQHEIPFQDTYVRVGQSYQIAYTRASRCMCSSAHALIEGISPDRRNRRPV